jgi:uncharacterized protein (DUF2147 family)
MTRFHARARPVMHATLCVLLLCLPALAAAQTSPVGHWQAVSDVDGKPSALIRIREVEGQLVGTIDALYSPADSEAVCDRCDGERRDQRVLGMQILWGMHPDGEEWSGGRILDPETGRIYRASMRLENDGRRLVVRGYVGFAMFGRSQVWARRQ